MVRHDDFPALLADPSGFAEKTLTEGRWVAYLWHLRPWGGTTEINFAIYLALWSLFCAAFSVNALGKEATLWHVSALSILAAIGTPTLLISLWFSTQIPSLAIIAVYAVLSLYVSERSLRWLLFLFVPLSIMAYTTHALLLLLVCITRAETRRSFRDLAGLVLQFMAAFAFGMLLVYTINYFYQGVFGIQVSEWRSPNPPKDLATLFQNLWLAVEVYGKFLHDLGFRFLPMSILHLGLFIVGSVVLLRQDLWRGLYILCGFAMGTGLIVLQIVMTGIDTPTRAATYAWPVYALIVVILIQTQEATLDLARRVLRIFVMAVIVLYTMQTANFYHKFPLWQSETRQLAQILPPGEGPIYLIGDFMTIDGAERAAIQSEAGLELRLKYLTGEVVILCNESPETCETAFAEGRPERLLTLPSDPNARFP